MWNMLIRGLIRRRGFDARSDGAVMTACRRGSRMGAGAALSLVLSLALLTPAVSRAAAPHMPTCEKIVLTGEVSAGREWKAAFGEGWVFRVLPIPPGKADYSGWDLAVDREQPAGYPDALLVATPPYNSINEREAGTTYGLRAQDAIGWNPRSFHFLTDPAAFREGQKLYLALSREGLTRQKSAAQAGQDETQWTRKLMELVQHASPGEFRILDARIAPGIADAAPYAENWALASDKTPHSVEPQMGDQPSALGELLWMRFSVTLWLPAGWKAQRGVSAKQAPCGE
jgi:hypothetical protein